MKSYFVFLMLLLLNVVHAAPYRIIVMSSVDYGKATKENYHPSYNRKYVDKELVDDSMLLDKKLQQVIFKKTDSKKIIPIFMFSSEDIYFSAEKGLKRAFSSIPYDVIIVDKNLETDYQVVPRNDSHKRGTCFILKVRPSFLRDNDRMVTILKNKIDEGISIYPSFIPSIVLSTIVGTVAITSGISSTVGLCLVLTLLPVGVPVFVGSGVVFIFSGMLIGEIANEFRTDMYYTYQNNKDGTTTILGYVGELEKKARHLHGKISL